MLKYMALGPDPLGVPLRVIAPDPGFNPALLESGWSVQNFTGTGPANSGVVTGI